MEEKKYITISEAVKLYGLSRGYFYELCHRELNPLPHIRPKAGMFLINREKLDEYLAALEENHAR